MVVPAASEDSCCRRCPSSTCPGGSCRCGPTPGGDLRCTPQAGCRWPPGVGRARQRDHPSGGSGFAALTGCPGSWRDHAPCGGVLTTPTKGTTPTDAATLRGPVEGSGPWAPSAATHRVSAAKPSRREAAASQPCSQGAGWHPPGDAPRLGGHLQSQRRHLQVPAPGRTSPAASDGTGATASTQPTTPTQPERSHPAPPRTHSQCGEAARPEGTHPQPRTNPHSPTRGEAVPTRSGGTPTQQPRHTAPPRSTTHRPSPTQAPAHAPHSRDAPDQPTHHSTHPDSPAQPTQHTQPTHTTTTHTARRSRVPPRSGGTPAPTAQPGTQTNHPPKGGGLFGGCVRGVASAACGAGGCARCGAAWSGGWAVRKARLAGRLVSRCTAGVWAVRGLVRGGLPAACTGGGRCNPGLQPVSPPPGVRAPGFAGPPRGRCAADGAFAGSTAPRAGSLAVEEARDEDRGDRAAGRHALPPPRGGAVWCRGRRWLCGCPRRALGGPCAMGIPYRRWCRSSRNSRSP